MTSIKKVRGTSGTPYRRGSIPSGSGRSVTSVTPTVRGRGSNPAQRNDIDARYDEMLKNNAGNNDFLSLLSSLGIQQEAGLNPDQRDDWNKQLLDTQLNYQLELEKRGYNEQMRDEQRIYDSPTNMLARLMGAGISRDAAIQMLSGAGGTSPIQTEGAVAGTGLSASESTRNGIESKLGIANTVFGGLSAIGSMVSLGFSIPQAIQQTQFLRSQNYMNSLQIKAYDSANMAFNVLSVIGASSDAFGSISSAAKAINDAAAKGDPVAMDYIQSGELTKLQKNGSIAAPLMAKMYKDNRDAKDYNQRFYNEQRKLVCESDVLDQQVLKLAQETMNSLALFDQINADTAFIKKQTEREQATIDYLKKQGRVADAEAYEKELKNRETESLYDTVITGPDGVEHTGLWYITQATLYDSVMGEMIGKAQNDPSLREFVCDKIACDTRMAYYAAAIAELQENQNLNFLVDNSAMSSFYNGLRIIGYYNYVESLSKGTYTLSTSDEIVTPLGNFGTSGSTTYRPTAPKVKTTQITDYGKSRLLKNK